MAPFVMQTSSPIVSRCKIIDNFGQDTLKAKVTHLLSGSADPQDQRSLITFFRHLLTCVDEPPLEESARRLVEDGCIPKFVELMKCEDDWELMFDTCWILGNISATQGPANTEAVVEAGAVPILISLLSSPHQSLRLEAMRVLANITIESPSKRDLLLSHGALTKLLPLLKEEENLVTSSWLLRGLIEPKWAPVNLVDVAPALPHLVRLALHQELEVCQHVCWALHHLYEGHGTDLYRVLLPSLPANFLQLLKTKEHIRSASLFVLDLGRLERAEGYKNQVDNSVKQPEETTKDHKSRKTLSAVRTTSRKRSWTPVLEGVSTRNTPKKFRLNRTKSITVQAPPPSLVTTRAAARGVITRTPNHSAAHSAQMKKQVVKWVACGDEGRVAWAMQDVLPTLTSGPDGAGLLHVAAENSQVQLVLSLLRLISPNVVDKRGRTPAHLAATRGYTQVLKLLLADPDMDPSKRDNEGLTYVHLLCSHLLEAVLAEDDGRVNSLLSVGADPDQQVNEAVSRQLGVSTCRQVAQNLQRHHILRLFSQVQPKAATDSSYSSQAVPFTTLPVGPLRLRVQAGSTEVRRSADVYRVASRPRGYVSVFSYGNFQQRPDLALEAAHPDSHNVASVFTKMGYTGHAYYDLTAEQTRHEVARVRQLDQLDSVDCAVFVVSSHGTPQQQVVTSDLQLVNADWFCQQFKDSQCPALRNKPKLFIFDLCCGYYQAEAERGRGAARGPSCRVEEPLRDMVCLYSNSGSFTGYTFTKEGSPFISALCRSLADHAHHHELSQLWRHLLSQLTTAVPGAAATLRNNGFTKQFYFNPGSPTSC